ncbi:protein hinderin isoform X2 [Xenopus laevis]|uniref:Protein hinderin isoform X2 n=1 Tax=Xenopus laevis TaxID=8355 RepID=A0A8J1L9N2_XENLA|nr:protein hinderin isoform X2 [Xenopus laevis]
MAGVAGFGAAGYWSEDASDEEQQLVYVPGLQTEGNLRSAPKSKTSISEGRKSNSQKPLLSSKMDLQRQQEQQVSPDEGGIKSASLKDLCPEDKRRIANLIKELARVSEEKEVTEERLKTEQESFEKKIRQLEDQNNLIGTEREALQQQYRECQELLSLYQTYLSEQQNKLHESPRRTRQVCEVNQHPTAGELNGSYLGQSHLRPGSDTSSSRSYGTNRRCRNDPACPIGFHVPNAVGRCCAKLPDRSLAQCCLHSASGNAHSTPARHPPERSSPCTHGNGIQTPPKKSSVSEERKHQLLLQKLELEVEKERLQQLLVQQETKLLVKQQQLQQSRLQRNSRPARPSSEGVTTPPSIKSSKKHHSGGKKFQKTTVSLCETQDRDPTCAEAGNGFTRGSTKDAATSPYAETQKPEPVGTLPPPAVQRGIFRYETSLIDMLDAISPISAERQRPRCRETDNFSPAPRIHSRSSRLTLSQSPRGQPPTEDPEESKMLEEIFFIC